jgi:hypothetical protein
LLLSPWHALIERAEALEGQAMTLKKTELYRGFNIFTEEVRAGAGIAKWARGKWNEKTKSGRSGWERIR